MTTEQLVSLGGLYFQSVEEGLEKYTYDKAKMNSAQAKAFFTKLWRKNGTEKAFADLYYFQLSGEEKQEVDDILTPEEREYLEKIRPNGNLKKEIIFPLDQTLLEIIVKCNEAEVMFSSFYFTNDEENGTSTWWSNFGHEYYGFWLE